MRTLQPAGIPRDWSPYDKGGLDRHAHSGEHHARAKDREQADASASRRTPGIAGKAPGCSGRELEQTLSRGLRKNLPLPPGSQTSGLQNGETIPFRCSGPSVCRTLLRGSTRLTGAHGTLLSND